MPGGLMRRADRWRNEAGSTLVELLVVVLIVGILAAIAIPVFSDYILESRLSEARTNIQSILEAEQAYFVRYGRYTQGSGGYCPAAPPPTNETQNWPGPLNDVVADCPAGAATWSLLGWTPDGPIYFQYRIFSHNVAGTLQNLPAAVLGGSANLFGVNWADEGFTAADIADETFQAWCAVEAFADSDGINGGVWIRGNSYNHKTYRFPNPDVDGVSTW